MDGGRFPVPKSGALGKSTPHWTVVTFPHNSPFMKFAIRPKQFQGSQRRRLGPHWKHILSRFFRIKEWRSQLQQPMVRHSSFPNPQYD